MIQPPFSNQQTVPLATFQEALQELQKATQRIRELEQEKRQLKFQRTLNRISTSTLNQIER